MTEETIKNLTEKPTPISIKELCQERFRFKIPSYQRGYRWTKREIKYLIDDVINFDETKDGKFYCLQPLVVRYVTGEWRVIDGQQRLTTIFLILKSLGYANDLFSLEYDRDDILHKLLQEEIPNVKMNCEIYHLDNCLKVISEYFKDIPEKKQELIDNIIDHCKFILYTLNDSGLSSAEADDLEHQLFNDLNSGKISLTESELIKALFLHNVSGDNSVRDIQQISMAEELDFIERTLRADEMWYFLAGDRPKPSSCIDYLYKVWYISKYDSIPADIDYPIFTGLESIAHSHIDMIELWAEIKQCFYVITGWYNDPLLYNLIGYLESRKKPWSEIKELPPMGEELMAQLYRYSINGQDNGNVIPTRKAFIRYVKSLCRSSIPKEYLNLRYDYERPGVYNLLLLVNVALMVNRKDSHAPSANSKKTTGKEDTTPVSRFPFHVLNRLSWNVEHISPQNPKKKQQLLDILTKLEQEYKAHGTTNLQDDGPDGNQKTLPPEVENLLKLMRDHQHNLESLDGMTDFVTLRSKFFPDDEELMRLPNLTLLTEHDNKGISNKLYFDKRNKLNEYQSKGSFLPASTINVFSKWHTSHPKDYIFWSEDDRASYMDAIKDTIDDFIKFCEHE